MNLYNTIKQNRLEARKEGRTDVVQNQKGIFLGTVMGDIQRRAEKEGCKDAPTNQVVLAEIKAYLKRYNAEAEERGLTQEQVNEMIWIEIYLPKEATKLEIMEIIAKVNPTEMKEMGGTMAAIKAAFDNVDMVAAKGLVLEWIQKGG